MSVSPQKKTGLILVGVAAGMLSLSFAAVPFYNWFCRATGFGGALGPGLGFHPAGDIGHAGAGGGLGEIKGLQFQVHGADVVIRA